LTTSMLGASRMIPQIRVILLPFDTRTPLLAVVLHPKPADPKPHQPLKRAVQTDLQGCQLVAQHLCISKITLLACGSHHVTTRILRPTLQVHVYDPPANTNPAFPAQQFHDPIDSPNSSMLPVAFPCPCPAVAREDADPRASDMHRRAWRDSWAAACS